LNYPTWSAGDPRQQPVLRLHENLIESRTHPRQEKRLRLI
jgi:hypothetical protein